MVVKRGRNVKDDDEEEVTVIKTDEETFSHGLLVIMRDHPAAMLILLLIQIWAPGIVYHWAMFDDMGLDLFKFAQPTDFLLAGFHNFSVTFAAIFGLMSVVLIIMFLSLMMNKILSKQEKQNHLLMSLIITIGLAFSVLVFMASAVLWPYKTGIRDAAEIKQNQVSEGYFVQLRKGVESDVIKPDSQMVIVAIVGDFIVLHPQCDTAVIILPKENIATMKMTLIAKEDMGCSE